MQPEISDTDAGQKAAETLLPERRLTISQGKVIAGGGGSNGRGGNGGGDGGGGDGDGGGGDGDGGGGDGEVDNPKLYLKHISQAMILQSVKSLRTAISTSPLVFILFILDFLHLTNLFSTLTVARMRTMSVVLAFVASMKVSIIHGGIHFDSHSSLSVWNL
jgi:hypothetical protein